MNVRAYLSEFDLWASFFDITQGDQAKLPQASREPSAAEVPDDAYERAKVADMCVGQSHGQSPRCYMYMCIYLATALGHLLLCL